MKSRIEVDSSNLLSDLRQTVVESCNLEADANARNKEEFEQYDREAKEFLESNRAAMDRVPNSNSCENVCLLIEDIWTRPAAKLQSYLDMVC